MLERKYSVMSELDEIRLSINKIDKEMAAAFTKRMELCGQVAEYKRSHGMQVLDAGREREVLERNSAYVESEMLKPYYMQYMQSVMDISKRYQHRLLEGDRIAYSGIEGAFAGIAAKRIFPDGEAVSYKNFAAAYESVVKGDCDAAVLPIENSYAGEVGQVMDLLFDGDLYVNGIYFLPIAQNLLAVKGAKLSDIRKVISHPQALDQCAEYIDKHGFERVTAENTARAARAVAEEGSLKIAAIASAETADLYGLEILDHDINESAANTTKFAVVSRAQTASGSAKEESTFMLMFTVRNEAGSLVKALDVIGRYGYNMRAVRSRPLKNLPFQYYFYVEAEGRPKSEETRAMLEELSEHCKRLKVLGSYMVEGNL